MLKPLPLKTEQIQSALAKAEFYKGKIDGIMGPKTRRAIKAFQKSRGLKTDGVIGPRTQNALSEYLN
ncbi:MAG: peptidoglycan-binding protein [Candidatus Omnitrophica bacterium]|nr:peptidoglycan-binding protein [Candidatus Omnitrophota bacterium]